jgi:hypothetical protein
MLRRRKPKYVRPLDHIERPRHLPAVGWRSVGSIFNDRFDKLALYGTRQVGAYGSSGVYRFEYIHG